MARQRASAPPASSASATRAITTQRAERLFRLLGLLGGGPQTRAALSRKLRLDVRSFYRDLELVRECGVPITSISGRYSLGESVEAAQARLPLPDPHLTLAEARTLAKGKTAAHRKLSGLLAEITAGLPGS
jgi:predicted DNA-binding transcriptional regulator YafY